jgi:hypothetical protein
MATFDFYPDIITFSRDPMSVQLGPSSGDPLARYLIEITIEDPNDTVTLPVFWQYGVGLNNLSERINAYFSESNSKFPNHGIITLHQSFALEKYSVTAKEYTGSPLAEYGSEVSTDAYGQLYVIHGGSSFTRIYDAVYNLYQIIQGSPVPFQTSSPSSKRTRTDMKEYLTFMFYDTLPVNFKTRVTLKFTNGTTSNYTITQSTAGTPAWDLQAWRVPCGYGDLDIASHLGGLTLWYYDITVEDNSGNTLTTSKRFYIDYTVYNSVRKLIWRNSRGGEDSFYFTGNEKFISAITQQSISHYVLPAYSTQLGDRTVSNKKEITSIKTGTWLESKELANWLRDMLLAEFIYEENGAGFFPIEILPGSFVIYDAEKTGYYIEFEYQYRYKNHSYTLG